MIMIDTSNRPTNSAWLQAAKQAPFVVYKDGFVSPKKSNPEWKLVPEIVDLTYKQFMNSPYFSSITIARSALSDRLCGIPTLTSRATLERRFREAEISLADGLFNKFIPDNGPLATRWNRDRYAHEPTLHVNANLQSTLAGTCNAHTDGIGFLVTGYHFSPWVYRKVGKLGLHYAQEVVPNLHTRRTIEFNEGEQFIPPGQGVGKFSINVINDDRLYHSVQGRTIPWSCEVKYRVINRSYLNFVLPQARNTYGLARDRFIAGTSDSGVG